MTAPNDIDPMYRTYDAQWNRTGYAFTQQYPGQLSCYNDFPARCPMCGGSIDRCWFDLDVRRYRAACPKGHLIDEQPIAELIEKGLDR